MGGAFMLAEQDARNAERFDEWTIKIVNGGYTYDYANTR